MLAMALQTGLLDAVRVGHVAIDGRARQTMHPRLSARAAAARKAIGDGLPLATGSHKRSGITPVHG